MLRTLINGAVVDDSTGGINVEERGLSYGDGVFETMLLLAGSVRYLESHLARMRMGCERLGIASPAESVLLSDIAEITRGYSDGIVKLIATRGAGGRGYRPTLGLSPTRIAILYPPPGDVHRSGITVRWCTTRLSRNPQLAGIKHLNRLEQVLAQSEWTDEHFAEGLMLDTEDEVVCATASNLFMVNDRVLITPDLRFSGVRGVMREQLIKIAQREDVSVEERPLRRVDLLGATELFVTNAIRGIRPIVALDDHRWSIGPLTKRLNTALGGTAFRD